MAQKPEVAPRKEKRAFALWVSAALLVLIAGIVVAAGALRTHPTTVSSSNGS